eukprot:m.162618 g.162618  ORF g.162618 m.162618 type:complete len:364 (+) comp12219_c0_seq1:260-1351(+)
MAGLAGAAVINGDDKDDEGPSLGPSPGYGDHTPMHSSYSGPFGTAVWKPGPQHMMVSMHGQMPPEMYHTQPQYWGGRPSAMWTTAVDDGASAIDKLVNVAVGGVGQMAPAAVPPPASYAQHMDPTHMQQHWGPPLPHSTEDQYSYNPAPYVAPSHAAQTDTPEGSRQRRPSVRMIAGAQALQGLAHGVGADPSSIPQVNLNLAHGAVGRMGFVTTLKQQQIQQQQMQQHQHQQQSMQQLQQQQQSGSKGKSGSGSRPSSTASSSPSDQGSSGPLDLATLESRSAKAKETHRQAEQRRRLQQIEAASELKKVLRMHEGTPLGVTLTFASEHIHELRKNEAELLKEIERQRRYGEELRRKLAAVS